MTIKIKLSPAQTQTVIDQDGLAAAAIISAAHSTITSNQFVFFAAFDGTNNDAKNLGNFNTTNKSSDCTRFTQAAEDFNF